MGHPRRPQLAKWTKLGFFCPGRSWCPQSAWSGFPSRWARNLYQTPAYCIPYAKLSFLVVHPSFVPHSKQPTCPHLAFQDLHPTLSLAGCRGKNHNGTSWIEVGNLGRGWCQDTARRVLADLWALQCRIIRGHFKVSNSYPQKFHTLPWRLVRAPNKSASPCPHRLVGHIFPLLTMSYLIKSAFRKFWDWVSPLCSCQWVAAI